MLECDSCHGNRDGCIGGRFLLASVKVLAEIIIQLQDISDLKGAVFNELVELRTQYGRVPVVAITQSQLELLRLALDPCRPGTCKTPYPG